LAPWLSQLTDEEGAGWVAAGDGINFFVKYATRQLCKMLLLLGYSGAYEFYVAAVIISKHYNFNHV